jgi:hypothetical protein
VAGLVIAIALVALATTLIASLHRENVQNSVQRRAATSTSVKIVKDSVLAYFLTGDDASPTVLHYRLPCPDTDMPPDGLENGTTTCAARTGVLPWLSLRLAETDVIDAYGNYLTYAVTSSDTARSVCTSVANSYNSSLVEFTGTLNDVTDTEVRLSSQSSGQGSPYYYAIISHGPNGLGAISSNGSRRSSPTSSSEIQNCPSSNTNCSDPSAVVLISGPSSTDTSSYFDDIVYVGSSAKLTDMCETLTKGGQVNADLSDTFTNTAVGSVPPLLTVDAGTVSVQQSTVTGNTTDKVLRFAGANSTIRSSSVALSAAERARYVSFEWRPTTLGTGSTAGVSLGLRATVADRNTTTTVGSYTADLFNTGTNDGLTIRFFEDVTSNANGATANRIYICDNTTPLCDNALTTNRLAVSSGTFTITANATYTIEAYDDGVQVWARITEVGTTNTASVELTTIPVAQQDFGGVSAVIAVNYSDATVEVDDLVVGRGGMAVSFDGTDDIVSTATDSYDTTTGNLTLETWFKPDTLPSSGNTATLISKWTEGGAVGVQAYRLYLNPSGSLTLQIAGNPGSGSVIEQHTFGSYAAKAGRWDHIAVTYNGTGTSDRSAKLYVNRELIARSSSTAFGTNGIQNGTAIFSIGADRNTTPATVNEFDGLMTDVRVWNTTRTAQEIFANYNRRLPLTSGGAAGLVVNWTLDRDTTASALPIFGTTGEALLARPTAVTGTANGTLTGATYVSALQQYVPVFASTSFCAAGGAQGAVVGAFQCDYRLTAQNGFITVPNNLASFHVKAWGAGGGAYDWTTFDSTGGGGGFSAGRLYSINGTSVTGRLDLRIDVSGGGTGSTTGNNRRGAGGGGASGLWRDVALNATVNTGTDIPGIIGGGGGGASSGDDNQTSPNCNAAGDCGPGGGGGGPNNIVGLSNVLAIRAPDASSNLCGGRGGHNSSFTGGPATATVCESGGTNPTTRVGASGGGTNTGGTSTAGLANGGAGHNGGTNQIGGGGGGGGIRLITMASGGGETGGYDTGTIDSDSGVPDSNGSGFGGGGGAGWADANAIGPSGEAARVTSTIGNNAAAGGTLDPNYSGSTERLVSGVFTTTAYCSSTGTPCTNTPGRGGEAITAPTDLRAGRPGAVILSW